MKPSLHRILPEYPSTLHLPWKPNTKGDKIASEHDAQIIFECPKLAIQEKIDGANCGMVYVDGHPVLRNRTKILKKGWELKNPSTAQFASAWNWMHEHKQNFISLSEYGPYSVYGEWMVQQHGMIYNNLQSWYIAYDIYDWEKQTFLASDKADKILQDCHFNVVPLSFFADPKLSKPITYEFLEECCDLNSWFCVDNKREGIVVKACDDDFVIAKFKMVRSGFEQGCLLSDTIKRNLLRGK